MLQPPLVAPKNNKTKLIKGKVMEHFKNKLIGSFMHALEFIDIAFHDLKKAYYNNQTCKEEKERVNEFIATIKNMVETIYKGAKVYKYLQTRETKASNNGSENLPYPKEMADMLSGMTPGDHNFLKSIQPEIAKMLGGE